MAHLNATTLYPNDYSVNSFLLAVSWNGGLEHAANILEFRSTHSLMGCLYPAACSAPAYSKEVVESKGNLGRNGKCSPTTGQVGNAPSALSSPENSSMCHQTEERKSSKALTACFEITVAVRRAGSTHQDKLLGLPMSQPRVPPGLTFALMRDKQAGSWLQLEPSLLLFCLQGKGSFCLLSLWLIMTIIYLGTVFCKVQIISLRGRPGFGAEALPSPSGALQPSRLITAGIFRRSFRSSNFIW